MKHKGIVLRTFIPTSYKVSLLDEKLGTIEVFIGKNKQYLSYFQHGALIHYSLNHQETNLMYSIKNIELVAIPFKLALEDILFFHHILELCYYFIPADSNTPMIFDLLYTVLFQGYTATTKDKLFYISLFFMYTGLYNEQVPFNMELLRTSSFDIIHKEFDLISEAAIKSWLMQCFNLHPHKYLFKTLSYYLPQEAIL